MPEIGETLREARMRRRIDMTEVEAATKIRAKYLRALENEEWDLLPGPTFVKTFLRTYAEYLELDPRMLVEEYRQRYERPSTQDLTPFGPGMGGQRRRRRQRRPIGPFDRRACSGSCCCSARCTCSASSGTGRATMGRPDNVATATPTATATATPAKKSSSKKKKGGADARDPEADRDRAGVRVPGGRDRQARSSTARTSTPGRARKTFRSQRFRANFGNGNIRMSVNGKRYTAADVGRPIGYEFRPGKKPKQLAESVRVRLCAT